jgi:hypothetical protein
VKETWSVGVLRSLHSKPLAGCLKSIEGKNWVKREYLDQLAAWFKEEVKGFFSMGQWQNDGTDSMLEDFL